MKTLCCIVSYKRPEKLSRLIDSILNNTIDSTISIRLDNNDNRSLIYLVEKYRPLIDRQNYNKKIFINVNDDNGYIGKNWNHILKDNYNLYYASYDGYLMLVDDVVLEPDCIEKAIKDMEKKFPDTDGVIGITQIGKQKKFVPAGQALIGKQFIERFKDVNYQVYCSQYKHWGIDTELWKYAELLDKFHLSTEAKLEHMHPVWYHELMDETHKITRGNDLQKRDMKMLKLRQKKGLIWGKTWEVIDE